MTKITDVLIIGAGPAGLMLAYELRRRNISCRIIDTYSEFPQTPRALGLQPRSIEILDNIGLAKEIFAHSGKITGRRIVKDGKEIARSTMSNKQRNDRPYTQPLFVNQAIIEKVLRDALSALGTTVELNRELDNLIENSHGVMAEVFDRNSGEMLHIPAKWVVGCDGAHSSVRKLLQLSFEGKDYPDYFAQADVYLDTDLPQDFLTTWFTDRGIVGAFPLHELGLWRILTRLEPDTDGNIPEASVELFQNLLDDCTQGETIKIREAKWVSNFTVRQRIVNRYRKGHVFVAGDAAHVHSPAGGQGLNTSIQDSFNLAWKLALVIQGHASEKLLDTYEAERLPIGQKVLQRSDFNHKLRLFGATKSQKNMQKIPGILSPLFHSATFLNLTFNLVMKRGSQLNINYRKSPLSNNDGQHKLHAGDRAPDGIGYSPAGEKIRLFDHFTTPQFRVLIFQGRRKTTDLAELFAIAEGYKNNDLLLPIVITTDKKSDAIIYDKDHDLHKTYGAQDAELFVIRPDGYIGMRCSAHDTTIFSRYLSRFGIEADLLSDRYAIAA